MKKQILVLLITVFSLNTFGQNDKVIPVQVQEQFSDINLTSAKDEITELPEKDRNTMLIFIRGKVTPTVWCPICHYQYLELVDAVKKTNFAEENDLDIYFVLPYAKDSLQNWINAFPKSLNTIHSWKNPEDQSEAFLAWKEYCLEFFPEDYNYDINNPVLDVPVLFDPGHKVSDGLFLYREEWGGTKVPQNIPTIYILNKEGKVRFKYHSQYTNDRPSANYLIEVVEKLL
ncbi:MAG: hypothetical protein C0597_03410 [Marinilabiliales bacterium]|nr:MAG: hypothetical protein C0597_03410 [Marinilabiliales bacterium]